MSPRAIGLSASLLFLAAVTTLLIVLPWTARQTTPRVALTFVGYCEQQLPDARRRLESVRCGAFRLSNGTADRLLYHAKSIEVWTESGWQAHLIQGRPTNWPLFGIVLAPRESCEFYVPSPTNGRWRIRLAMQERTPGWRGYYDRLTDHLSNRGRRVRRETFNGGTQEVLSSEVTQ